MPKTSYSFIIPLFLVFLLVQCTGLYLGYNQMLAMQEENIEPLEDSSYGAGIIAILLIETALILLVIKYLKSALKLMRVIAFILLSVFVVAFFELLLYTIIPEPLPTIIGGVAAIVILSSALLKKNWIANNLLMFTAVIFAGSASGALLGFYPVLVFAILITIYDYIAVFKTKHMVTLAKAVIQEKIPATITIPTKDHTYNLGNGDLFVPMTLSVSVMRELGLTASLFTLFGSCLGMAGIFLYLATREKKPLPALPPIMAGSMLGLLAYLIMIMI